MRTKPWTSDWKQFPYCVVADGWDEGKDYRGVRSTEPKALEKFQQLQETGEYSEIRVYEMFGPNISMIIKKYIFD